MRERPGRKGRLNDVDGITPACAGKTLQHVFYRMLARGSPPHVRERQNTNKHFVNLKVDHPRMCGKDLKMYA